MKSDGLNIKDVADVCGSFFFPNFSKRKKEADDEKEATQNVLPFSSSSSFFFKNKTKHFPRYI